MKQLIVFLDANVLYSAGLRDLLIRLSLQGLYRIKWSNQVHDEWTRNLLAKRNDLSPEKLIRTRQLMIAFAPDSLVEGYESLIETLSLPDPDDRHVLAAAIVGRADALITFNLSDFPHQVLQQYSLKAWHPDVFVSHLLDMNAEQVCIAVRQHRTALKHPSKTVEEYLLDRKSDGLSSTAWRLGKYTSLI